MAKTYIHNTQWKLPQEVSGPLQKIKEGVTTLKSASGDNKKEFTLDGRLIGDIGELLTEHFFNVSLHKKQQQGNDGLFTDKEGFERQVEVKCRRMSTGMWFDSEPEFLVVFKMHQTSDDSEPETCTLVYAGLGDVLHKVRGQIAYKETTTNFPKPFKERQTISLNQLAQHFDYESFIEAPTIPLKGNHTPIAPTR